MRSSRIGFLALALTVVGVFASAQPTRTLKSLVELAVQRGEASALDNGTAKTLGLGSENVPTKVIWFDQDKTPDQHEHTFNVVLENDKPATVVLMKSRMVDADEGKKLDGYAFRLTPAGKLVSAVKISAVGSEVKQKRLKPAEMKPLFESEKKFWTIDSLGLEWGK